VRWLDTVWVFGAMGLFSAVFAAATLFAMRLDLSVPFDAPKEAILIYAPWEDPNARLAQLEGAGAQLVSSNASDTAWLVRLPTAQSGKDLLAQSAMAAFHPSEFAIVLAGCGAVSRSDVLSATHGV